VTQLKDGTILVVEWVAEGPQPDGYFLGKLWESQNEWETLKGPFESKVFLPQGKSGFDDGGRPYGGVNFHRTLIEMPNGDLLATAYGWFKEDVTPSSYMKTMMKFRSLLLRSKDRGRNWALVSTIAVDPAVGEEGFCEPVLLRVSQGKRKGRLIAQMRTGSNKVLTDPKFNLIHQTESDDEGKTWTRPHPLSFQGVDPDLIEMHNGILVAGFRLEDPGVCSEIDGSSIARRGAAHARSKNRSPTWKLCGLQFGSRPLLVSDHASHSRTHHFLCNRPRSSAKPATSRV
jgi:hypothetical protein